MYKMQGVDREETSPNIPAGEAERLGQAIRDLRSAHGLTLTDLGKLVGRTAGYLSLLERGRAQASIETMTRLATAFGVSLSWFFPEPNDANHTGESVVVRGPSARTLTYKNGVRNTLMSPSLRGPIELLRTELEPGADSGENYNHIGDEAGYVMEGELKLVVDDVEYHLQSGDAFSFPCSKPHRFSNPGDAPCIVIWVLSPPSF